MDGLSSSFFNRSNAWPSDSTSRSQIAMAAAEGSNVLEDKTDDVTENPPNTIDQSPSKPHSIVNKLLKGITNSSTFALVKAQYQQLTESKGGSATAAAAVEVNPSISRVAEKTINTQQSQTDGLTLSRTAAESDKVSVAQKPVNRYVGTPLRNSDTGEKEALELAFSTYVIECRRKSAALRATGAEGPWSEKRQNIVAVREEINQKTEVQEILESTDEGKAYAKALTDLEKFIREYPESCTSILGVNIAPMEFMDYVNHVKNIGIALQCQGHKGPWDSRYHLKGVRWAINQDPELQIFLDTTYEGKAYANALNYLEKFVEEHPDYKEKILMISLAPDTCVIM